MDSPQDFDSYYEEGLAPFQIDMLYEKRSVLVNALAQHPGCRLSRTMVLTKELTLFFERRDYIVEHEVPSQIIHSQYAPAGANQKNFGQDNTGRIDMRVIGQEGILDIEIDTSNKMKSLFKLADSRAKGNWVLWVRHGALRKYPCADAQNMIIAHHIPVMLIPTTADGQNCSWPFAPVFE